MPWSTTALLDEATRVSREIAVHQGLAYSNYGKALHRFGESEIGWSELVKESSDLYIREAAHTYWTLVRAEVTIYSWLLTMPGAKVVRPEGELTKDAAPAGKPAQRGRR